jgi:hypothetical protein
MTTELHPRSPRHTPRGRGITAAEATAATRPRLADAYTGTEQPRCVIPNSANPVDEDVQPCSDCLREFGAHLRTYGARPLNRAEIADRDGYADRAYQLRTTAESSTRPPSPRRRGQRR